MREAPLLNSGAGKTATVVVLIVFLQLLVIAVLGLGAISRDRKEGVREARARADADATLAADVSLERLEGELVDLLGEATTLQSPEDLQRFVQRGPGEAVRAAYGVDAEGVIYWLTGTERLWLPETVCEALDESSEQQRDSIPRLVEEYKQAFRAEDLKRAVGALQLLVHVHALRVEEGVGVDVPTGVGWARTLVHFAALAHLGDEEGRAVAQGIDAAQFREVLLRALETEAINRGRPQFASREMRESLTQLSEGIDAAVLCAPDHVQLSAMIDSFRQARTTLDALRPALATAVASFRAANPAAGEHPRLINVAGELLAVAHSEAWSGRVVALLLDADVLRRLLSEGLDHEGLERRGLRLELLRRTDPVVGQPLLERDLAKPGALELPLRAVLHRDRAPGVPSGGPSEAFYLGIIGLAAVGLVVGSVVLLRLWRREVRLARLKADFVSNLSHELKTPLTSISLFTEMLREGKLTSEEDRAEGLAILSQESERLQRIVARMIDVARREARGTAYDLEPGDLNAPVRDAALRLRRIVTEPGLDLVLDLAAEPLPVLQDATAVDDAVTNLLSNAWKYKRGARARIEVRTRRRGRKAEIQVSDDGVGIPRHERKRVFEMFYRAENYLTRDVAGTGLGLALVRTIVRAHRGRVRIESGPGGVGTSFRLRLPLTRRPLPEAEASTPAPAAALALPPLRTTSTP